MRDFGVLVLRILGAIVLVPFAAVVVVAMVVFFVVICVLVGPLALFEFAYGVSEEDAR